MKKIRELKRIIYEEYTDEELLEYYTRKINLLKQAGNVNHDVILHYVRELNQLYQKLNEKEKTR